MATLVPPSLFGLPTFLRKYLKKAEGDPVQPETPPKKPAKVVPANYQPTPEELESQVSTPMPEWMKVGYSPPLHQGPQAVPPDPLDEKIPHGGYVTTEEREKWREVIEARQAKERAKGQAVKPPKEAALHFASTLQASREFIQEAKEYPEDNSVRLLWADWLRENGQDDLADTIQMQVALYEEPSRLTNDQKNELARKVNQIGWKHPEWFGPWSWVGVSRPRGTASMDRGMLSVNWPADTQNSLDVFYEALGRKGALANVSSVTLGLRPDASPLPLIEDSSWIREISSLTLHGENEGLEQPARLLQSILSNSENLRSLSLNGLELGSGIASYIARSPNVQNLRTLDLSENNLDWQGIETLVNSRNLRHLRELYLHDNPLDIVAIGILLDSPYLRDLRKLSVSVGGRFGENFIRALQQRFPGDVLELHQREEPGGAEQGEMMELDPEWQLEEEGEEQPDYGPGIRPVPLDEFFGQDIDPDTLPPGQTDEEREAELARILEDPDPEVRRAYAEATDRDYEEVERMREEHLRRLGGEEE